MSRLRTDVWVGLFVLIGGIALLFLALKAANLTGVQWGNTSYPVVARFDNIGGLKPRAAVKSAGVVVGRVESISFDDKRYQASVNLALESRYVFPKDSSLKILTSGLLGEQYIGIEPGAEEKLLVAGDVINQTQSAVVLETLISQFLYKSAADSGSPTQPSPAAGTGAQK